MANWVEVLDAQIASILADWSILTTFLAIVIAAIVAYPIIFPEDPDTHPLLLARQSINSPVRNKGESAVYRSPEGPPGYPLTTGLNVKEAGAPKWAAGKDGDLRDIWREVQKAGTTGADGKQIPKGRIMTVMGRDEVVEHDFEDLSKEINIIGQHLKVTGATKVGIYLPNSVEYLSTIFGKCKVQVCCLSTELIHDGSLRLLWNDTSPATFQSAGGETLRADQYHWSWELNMCRGHFIP